MVSSPFPGLVAILMPRSKPCRKVLSLTLDFCRAVFGENMNFLAELFNFDFQKLRLPVGRDRLHRSRRRRLLLHLLPLHGERGGGLVRPRGH